MNKVFKVLLGVFSVFFSVFAVQCGVMAAGEGSDLEVDGFNIMPKLEEDEVGDVNQKIEEIGEVGGNVWNKYNEIASSEGFTTSKQVASGIMNRDTIMNYLVFIVQFMSQLGLFVGVGFIMYAGYKYMLSVFNGGKLPTETVKNAIIGVVIVIFSYAIMKTLTSFIGIS